MENNTPTTNNTASPVSNVLPNIDGQQILNSAQYGIENVGTAVANTTENAFQTVKGSLDDFSSQSYIDAGKEFLDSNSLIAKFAFILLIVVLFIFLFNLGILFITYFTQKSSQSPFLVAGTINGNQYKHITQDPKLADSITIQRSNNQPTGIENSWSVWLNIIDPGPANNKYRHIFNMGNGDFDSNGIATVNNAPGLYLKNQNNLGVLHVVMDTIQNKSENDYQTIDIDNVPLNKWFHVLLRMENNILDVYINGVITSRLNLNNTPRLNYNDIYVCSNNGFNGSLSNLQYFNRSLNIFEINQLLASGPNTNAAKAGSSSKSNQGFQYLSANWFSSNQR
jgi:hypothetical protein